MRRTVAASILLASLLGIGTAGAAECPADALGVSRTLVVDVNEHPRVGSWQYGESLPLNDHEVVLTFDDGPLPPYTDRVLDLLAAECVKATFFMVGRMVQAYPAAVRRVYNEGHTIANHSQTHPFTFHKMSVDQASREIEGGFSSLRTALGDPKAVAPFFRFPGLLRQTAVEQYLADHGDMTWSVDLAADDWTHINNRDVARRAISRLEARGKGILLLHDIQARTALALPEILQELKARGYKIVHVVPATPDRPKTVTEPELWAARHAPEPKFWPRTLAVGVEKSRTGARRTQPCELRRRICRSDDKGCHGTKLRPAVRRAGVAEPGRLCRAVGSSCLADRGRAQFPIHARVPVGRAGEAEGCGQEVARTHGAAACAGVWRLARFEQEFTPRRPSALGGAPADQFGRAANALN